MISVCLTLKRKRAIVDSCLDGGIIKLRRQIGIITLNRIKHPVMYEAN
jgi:hypothetical protein